MAISQYDLNDYAQYKPLSTQEIWAPSQAMRAQHDQLQEEYAQQEQQGGLSLLGIDPVKDKAAYDIQQNFITKTKEAADQLATKGFIDSGRRRGLMEVKSLYTNQVVPLQNQLKIRQERAEELRRMQLQDPTFRATANPNDISLTEGLKSPTAFNYDGVSGNQLYKSVAEKANQLSKIVEQEHPELIKSGLAYQYFTAVKSGANLSQIDKAMRQQFNPADVDKMTNLMHGVVSSTMNEFGVPQKFGNNQKVQDELWQVASQGLYAAAGQTNFGSMHDSWSEGNARRAQELADKKLEGLSRNGLTIYGSPEKTNIYDPGYVGQTVAKLKSVDFKNRPPVNTFDKKGNLIQRKQPLESEAPSGWAALDPVSYAAYGMKKSEYKQYSTYKGMINSYKNLHPELKGMADRDILSKIQSDANAVQKITESTQHDLRPITHVGTGQAIINKAFYSGAKGSEFYSYDLNYAGDSDTGTDLDKIAKRSGFENKDQLNEWMDKNHVLPKVDRNNGLYTVEIPNNIKSIDKNGKILYNSNAPSTTIIGFSTGSSHKHVSESMRTANKYRVTGTTGNLPSDFITIGDKTIKINPVYNSDNTISLYDDKNNPVNISSRNGISTNKLSYESFMELSNNTIEDSETIPAYRAGSQKQTEFNQ